MCRTASDNLGMDALDANNSEVPDGAASGERTAVLVVGEDDGVWELAPASPKAVRGRESATAGAHRREPSPDPRRAGANLRRMSGALLALCLPVFLFSLGWRSATSDEGVPGPTPSLAAEGAVRGSEPVAEGAPVPTGADSGASAPSGSVSVKPASTSSAAPASEGRRPGGADVLRPDELVAILRELDRVRGRAYALGTERSPADYAAEGGPYAADEAVSLDAIRDAGLLAVGLNVDIVSVTDIRREAGRISAVVTDRRRPYSLVDRTGSRVDAQPLGPLAAWSMTLVQTDAGWRIWSISPSRAVAQPSGK